MKFTQLILIHAVKVSEETFPHRPKLLLERAAAPWFGIRAFGVHVNGFVRSSPASHLDSSFLVERPVEALWVARRALNKPTYGASLLQ